MLDRLSRSDRWCAGGAVVTAISCFLAWFSYSTATSRVTVNAFRSGIFGDAVYLCAAAVVLALLVRMGVVRLRLPVAEGRLILGLAAAGAAAVVLQLLVGTSHSHGFELGLVLALLGSAATLYGAVSARREGA